MNSGAPIRAPLTTIMGREAAQFECSSGRCLRSDSADQPEKLNAALQGTVGHRYLSRIPPFTHQVLCLYCRLEKQLGKDDG
jgi:hypothetical protein